MTHSIYISNLHRTTKRIDVIQMFSKYGNISHCKVYCNKFGTCRGFANLTFENLSSYEMAVKAEITFRAKDLKIEPYLDNSEALNAKARELENLRICVLNIPRGLESSHFEELFTKLFGPITSAYVKSSPSKLTNYGFVTFKEKEQCLKAISVGKIRINPE